MTYLNQSKGTNPSGDLVNIPVGGNVFLTTVPLAANASTDTGWIPTPGYGSLLYVIRADQVSATNGILIEYSDDGTSSISAGGGLTYSAAQVGMQIQRVLVPKAQFTRITYTNGSTAQTTFRLEVKLSPTLIQPTETSLNAGLTGSELSMVTADVMFASDGTSFGQIQRTGSSLNVNVTGSAATDFGTDGTGITQPTGGSSLRGWLSGIFQKESLIESKLPSLGPRVMAQSISFTLATDQGPIAIRPPSSSSATATRITTVASTSGQILPANANRKGFSISSEGTLYVLFGTGTASSSNYSVRIVANGYYEPPEDLVWQGAIQAVGAVLQVTEFL